MMTEAEELSSPTSTTTPVSGEMDSGHSSPKARTMEEKASYRKSNKPMMEKKRRARINSCLSQLKSLVLAAMKKDNSQYSKLEKADILELTVKHLKNIQRYQAPGMAHGAVDAASKYRAGFNECASEVMRYMAESQGVDTEARTRILAHLASLLSPLNSSPTPILPAPPASALAVTALSQLQQQQQQQQLLQQLQQQQQQQAHLQQLQQLQHLQQQQQQQQMNQALLLSQQQHGSQTQRLGIDSNNNDNLNNNNNNDNTTNLNLSHPAFLPAASSAPSGTIIINDNNNNISQDISMRDSPPSAFQVPTPPHPRLHPPHIATTIASSRSHGLQFVPTSLPGGQVALVLAPQAKAVNLKQSHAHQKEPQPQGFTETRPRSDKLIPQEVGVTNTSRHMSQRKPSDLIAPRKASSTRHTRHPQPASPRMDVDYPGTLAPNLKAETEVEASPRPATRDDVPAYKDAKPCPSRSPYPNPQSVKNLAFAYQRGTPRCGDQKASAESDEDSFGRRSYSSISSNDDENMDEDFQPVALVTRKKAAPSQPRADVERMETSWTSSGIPSSSPSKPCPAAPRGPLTSRNHQPYPKTSKPSREDADYTVSKSVSNPLLQEPNSNASRVPLEDTAARSISSTNTPPTKSSRHDFIITKDVHDKNALPSFQHTVGRFPIGNNDRSNSGSSSTSYSSSGTNIVKTTSTWRPW